MPSMRASTVLLLALVACGPKGGAPSPADPVSNAGSGGAQSIPQGTPGEVGSGTLWRASVDLDGDGRPDEIVLTSPDVTRAADRPDDDLRINLATSECPSSEDACRGQLAIGGASVELPIRSGY